MTLRSLPALTRAFAITSASSLVAVHGVLDRETSSETDVSVLPASFDGGDDLSGGKLRRPTRGRPGAGVAQEEGDSREASGRARAELAWFECDLYACRNGRVPGFEPGPP